MKKVLLSALLCAVGMLVPAARATVSVTAPIATQPQPQKVHFVATSSTTCSRGVASMGIYVDDVREVVEPGKTLDTYLTLPLGPHRVVVEEWDYCGRASTQALSLSVVPPSSVTTTSPINGSTVTANSVRYTATASALSCLRGVASMGVYDGTQLIYVSPTPNIDAEIPMQPGVHTTFVQEWDFCGSSVKQPITVTVNAVPPPPVPVNPGPEFSNIQAATGWLSWGQQGPLWQDCPYPCPGITWSLQQTGVSPSLSGSAAQFNLGGTAPYSDVLFANHLIGYLTSQGMPDTAQTIVPTLHHFVYSGDFYTTTGQKTYALELDVNSYPGGGVGMTFGTQCRIFGGNGWDVWDSQHWIQTGKACNPVEGGWNHFIIDVTRDSANNLIYNSITLNGVVNTLNLKYPPFTVPMNWYGLTVNVQLDGDNVQDSTSVVVDNLHLTTDQ